MPTPTGKPAWVRTNDHTAYGGHVNKTNYESVGTVNPRTDLSAQNLCRIAADLAAIARTAPFAIIKFTCNDSSPAAPTILTYWSMAGGQPTPSRNGTGDVTFTWSASYDDPYGVAGSINIFGTVATVDVLSSTRFCTTLSGSVSARIQVWNDAGAAVGDQTVTAIVYSG